MYFVKIFFFFGKNCAFIKKKETRHFNDTLIIPHFPDNKSKKEDNYNDTFTIWFWFLYIVELGFEMNMIGFSRLTSLTFAKILKIICIEAFEARTENWNKWFLARKLLSCFIHLNRFYTKKEKLVDLKWKKHFVSIESLFQFHKLLESHSNFLFSNTQILKEFPSRYFRWNEKQTSWDGTLNGHEVNIKIPAKCDKKN